MIVQCENVASAFDNNGTAVATKWSKRFIATKDAEFHPEVDIIWLEPYLNTNCNENSNDKVDFFLINVKIDSESVFLSILYCIVCSKRNKLCSCENTKIMVVWVMRILIKKDLRNYLPFTSAQCTRI